MTNESSGLMRFLFTPKLARCFVVQGPFFCTSIFVFAPTCFDFAFFSPTKIIKHMFISKI